MLPEFLVSHLEEGVEHFPKQFEIIGPKIIAHEDELTRYFDDLEHCYAQSLIAL